ncbi:hypothetical protein NEIRO03_0701 [Nematocida sp. AWRm78]|nr:hypothetical protein NEIRO02_0907 [Nematocida sp. AWRm79]KAI5183077.1 hypothetical protein NEIRO03_0701 [Nematocida sp. AWRm78]
MINIFDTSKIISIISFFIEYSNPKSLIDSYGNRKINNLKEFEPGFFLDSPKFLIQSYIYQYVKTVEDSKKINQAVYEILNSLIENKFQLEGMMENYKNLFKRCFLSGIQAESTLGYIKIMQKLANYESGHKTFLFETENEKLSYDKTTYYDQNQKKFLENFDMWHSKHVETVVLAMFCSFAYDQASNKYTLESLGNAAPPLKQFFSKYNSPTNIIDNEMESEWSAVITSLESKHIAYDKENRILPGILNCLCAVMEMAGLPSSDIDRLIQTMEQLNANHSDVEKTLSNIGEYVQEICEKISYNKEAKIMCDFTVQHRQDYKKDIMGSISMVHIINGQHKSIKIDVTTEHMIVFLCPKSKEDIKNDIKSIISIKKMHKCKNTLVSMLVNHVIAIKALDAKGGNSIETALNHQIKLAAKKKYFTINRVMMIKGIKDAEYKVNLIKYILNNSRKRDIGENLDVVRIIANILVSLPIDTIEAYTKLNYYLEGYKIDDFLSIAIVDEE